MERKSGVKGRTRKKPALKPVEEAEVNERPADYMRIFCPGCGKRLTLRSQNPERPGLGPYQGYCRRPCAVEYIVQVNPIG